MKAIHQYFLNNKSTTLFWMWVFFAITLGYMLLQMYVMPQLNFWLAFIPGLICLYLRLTYGAASYDSKKNKFSKNYVPGKKRK